MSTTTTVTHSPGSTFLWLLKREYWEYRGSFFWAPVVTGIVMLAICAVALISAQMFVHQHGVTLNGINLDELSKHVASEDIEKVRAGVDVGLVSMGFPIAIVFYIVALFYCLGALYNDRADRSVLFWKSLPLSDTQTVLAKVVTAAVVAPLIAVAASIAMQLGFLILLTLYTLANGVNAIGLLWSPVHLLAVWLKLLVLLPVNALWALPCIGWFLLCSSFARSRPFLWGFGLPLVSGFVVSSLKFATEFSLSSWYWRNIVGRLLFSLAPGSWLDFSTLRELDRKGGNPPQEIMNLLSLDSILQKLSSPDLLIGVAAGAVMISAAIFLRRRRVEAYA